MTIEETVGTDEEEEEDDDDDDGEDSFWLEEDGDKEMGVGK
jgi:hypothetical protein